MRVHEISWETPLTVDMVTVRQEKAGKMTGLSMNAFAGMTAFATLTRFNRINNMSISEEAWYDNQQFEGDPVGIGCVVQTEEDGMYKFKYTLEVPEYELVK